MKNLGISLLGLGLTLISASASAETIVPANQGKPYYFNQWTCFVPYSQTQVSAVGGNCGSGLPNNYYWEIYLQNSTSSTTSRTFYAYGRQANTSACVGGCHTSCVGVVSNLNGDFVTWTGNQDLPTTAGWVTLGTLSVAAGNPISVECLISENTDPNPGYLSAIKVSGGAL